jgi:hypothetical protein
MRSSAVWLLVLRLFVGVCGALGVEQPVAGQVVRVPLEFTPVASGEADVIVRGSWGSRPGQFGKVDEASRPGPMDFAVTDRGLYVLDPVNARVQLFGWDGGFSQAISIGTKTADFLAVDERGQVIVLDAFVKRDLRVFSPAGELVVDRKLPGSIGLPSAVLTEGGRVYIEERHNLVYEVIVTDDRSGAPAQVVGSITGRPRAGRRAAVHVRKEGTNVVVLRTAPDVASAQPLTLQFPRPITAVVGVESDERGRIYVAATSPRDPQRDAWKADILLSVTGPDGSLVGSLCLADAYITDHYRTFGVSRAGDIIQMQTTADGVRFVRWTLPKPAEGGDSR